MYTRKSKVRTLVAAWSPGVRQPTLPFVERWDIDVVASPGESPASPPQGHLYPSGVILRGGREGAAASATTEEDSLQLTAADKLHASPP